MDCSCVVMFLLVVVMVYCMYHDQEDTKKLKRKGPNIIERGVQGGKQGIKTQLLSLLIYTLTNNVYY